jgi:LAS superfamily LD-carboxypeptidase LdcB
MPGTSRHHWGTDIDLNSFSNKWFESGKGLKLFNWLEANAAKYGFCRPYTANRPHGYQEEKWHWSYSPLSVPMIKVAQQTLNDQQISGFLGSETAQQIGVVNKYILGISNSCR